MPLSGFAGVVTAKEEKEFTGMSPVQKNGGGITDVEMESMIGGKGHVDQVETFNQLNYADEEKDNMITVSLRRLGMCMDHECE